MEPIDRAALREKARAFWCGRCITSPGTLESPCEMCGSVSGTVLALLDALDAAERERDESRRIAEASLVVPCACGRPMPSVSSRLRCDACRAEGERDEARAACAEMREAVESARLTVVRHSRDWSRHDSDAWLYGLLVGWPADVVPQLPGPWPQNPSETARLSRLSAAFASDAGAPLLAELRALRKVRVAAEAFLSPPTLHAIGEARARLRAALDAAKGGG